MKRLLYTIPLLLLSAILLAQTTSEKRSCKEWYDGFIEALDTVQPFSQLGYVDTMPLIREYLNMWEKEKPQCADWYTCNFNYHYRRAVFPSITTSTKLPPYVDEAMTLTDSIGNAAGYLYQGYFINDSVQLDMAIDWLEQGLLHYPDRLDIWQGEITALLYADSIEGMMALFDRLLAYNKQHTGVWLYANDTPGRESVNPVDDPVTNTVQDKMYGLSLSGYYEEAMQLIDIALKHYPSSPIYLNDKGVLYYQNGDYVQALVWMQKASKANPKDKLIKQNISYLKKEIRKQNRK